MPHHILLVLEIPFSTKWHTGSGEGSLMTDRLVRRDSRNHPFIPAATLKGIIRQSCEKLSRTRNFPEPSDPHNKDLKNSQAFVPFDQIESPVDCLFGTRYEPGRLFFRDARLNKDVTSENVVRNRVARHRILKTAKDKHLFTTEYIEPAVLHTRIDGRHDNLVSFDDANPPYAYCLLIAGVLAVERIGGDKSTGSGWLERPIKLSAEYNGTSVKLADVFDFLDAQDYADLRG